MSETAAVEPGAMAEDQATELAALEAAAKGQGAPAGEPMAGEPAPVDTVEESRQMWAMVFTVAGGIMPEVERLYTPERIERIAVAWVPLAQKRGWDLGDLFGRWAPEIMFVVAIIPPEMGKAIAAMVRAKLAGRRAPATVEQAPEADKPGAAA